MLCAADFRAHARMALSGKWMLAVIAGLIAGLLGAGSLEGPEVSVNFTEYGSNVSLEYFGQTLFSTAGEAPGLMAWLTANAFSLIIVAVLMAVIFAVIGSTVSVGYARFNLNLTDGFEASLNDLLSFFHRMKTAFCAHFLMALYILLWSLLFLIPGIIASYSYALTDYILAENPDLTAGEAIARSKEMMSGNRWRLFCLQFSFIGWVILCAFTFGIGNLWLHPYQEAATAAFYRSLTQPDTPTWQS